MSQPTQQQVQPTARSSGRHPVNIGHLVMGVALVGLVSVWGLVVGDVVEGGDIRFLLPVPWVLAGLAGLVALATSDRRRHQRTVTGWVEAPAPDDTTRDTPGEDPSRTMEE